MKIKSSSFGFTLIEVMIVLAILGAIIAVAAPKLFSSSTQMRAAIRKLAVLTRDIRNNARLYNSTTRLVIVMDNEKGHSYSVESAPGNALLLSDDQVKALDNLNDEQKEAEKKRSQFSPEKRVLPKAVTLPKGLFFDNVEYASHEKPVVTGTTYIHFFPQGMSEAAAIHLTNRKTLNWTILINPLTGRAEIFERNVSLKELTK